LLDGTDDPRFRDPWKMAGGGSHSATTIADSDGSHRGTAKEQ
jgi:hypothetical protein